MGMQLIETIEVGAGGAASIEFTGIPQDGVDLVLVTSLRHDGSEGSAAKLQFNSSTANYNYQLLYGTGSSVITSGGGPFSEAYAGYVNWSTSTANTFGNSQIYISNYTSSANKSISVDAVSENNASNARQSLWAESWNDTTAISSIQISGFGVTYQQYSTASLYKIY